MYDAASLQRMTKQRKLLMEILAKNNWHPTAEELYLLARERLATLSLGTVYRTLEVLYREGYIQKVEAEGTQQRYDGNPSPHAHAQCLRCLRVWDAEITGGWIPASVHVKSPGFEITNVRTLYEGYCAECQER